MISHGPTLAVSPTFAATSRSCVNALSAAMPNRATATPKCAMTMPHTGSGSRRSERPCSGRKLATATPAAIVIPSNGISLMPPNTDTPISTASATATVASTGILTRWKLSRRQRSSGPTASTISIGTKNTALTGLK